MTMLGYCVLIDMHRKATGSICKHCDDFRMQRLAWAELHSYVSSMLFPVKSTSNWTSQKTIRFGLMLVPTGGLRSTNPKRQNRLKIIHGGTIASMVDLGGSLAVASMGLYATGVSTDLNGETGEATRGHFHH